MFLSSSNKSQQSDQTADQHEGEPDPEPLYDDEHDSEFDTDDENCPWWSEDDTFNSDCDEQPYIPFSNEPKPQIWIDYIEQPEGTISVPCFDPNPINNKNKTLTSNKLLPTVKSWICEHCNAINNLYHSFEERQFKCISCDNYYRPGQILIESKAEDKPLYTIWICYQCSYHNDIQWNKCNMCSCDRPLIHLQIFQIADKPKAINEFDNFKPFSLPQSMQFKVNCEVNDKDNEDKNKWVSVCNNKNNIASNNGNLNDKKEKNDRTFREFDELQNYKSDIIEFVDNLFCDKNNKKLNSKSNYTSNWNCDFKFIE